ncbi:MAG: fibrillarin-like rRNA/tRNA 2'-O-methyltransferase [Thermoplasmatales archaeon]|nr:fibrillarin-like rRNA/tRNA 2'-O-methyltransferase [Candidatus Thermoplasmatota archaeon]MCL6003089.1 fibrillarin-like rRNA/tRNA 2'-O-methyltransferase [Candidatus Thermoplasmatota archaeon]MDA8054392.1 fibrillarin-like rRNA/tRNA 2'-O-methyltransferase [Thermoplasmatales archaeon]
MRELQVPNLFEERGNLYSQSRDGKSIYGEQVTNKGGRYYRVFSPLRSKLSSSIRLGLKPDIRKGDHMLYLGAGTGTTASHIADSLSAGTIFAVEFAPVPFIKLTSLSGIKDNLFPILSDAQKPEMFGMFIDKVDVIYQDVSQPNQIEIFAKNMGYFGVQRGILMLKTFSLRSDFSIDKEIGKIRESFSIQQIKDISRFHRGHYAITVSSN